METSEDMNAQFDAIIKRVIGRAKKRKKPGTSPTQRTLAELRKRGYLAAVVEKWNPHARIRQDMFGFIDVLGVKDGDTLAIQTTSGDHVADRVQKVADSDKVGILRKAGWHIAVWGWRKAATGRWTLREVDCS